MNLACRWVAFCAFAISSTPALASGISGTYVGNGQNTAFLVQIVQTDDGHLIGRYEQVILQQRGKLDDMNAEISGASDGQTVAMTINTKSLKG